MNNYTRIDPDYVSETHDVGSTLHSQELLLLVQD
jgi:hypothetical protein